MKIGFDISQTGKAKAGCGFYAHAMISAMVAVHREHSYQLFPSFGDFYFDPAMPLTTPYSGHDVSYGPRHLVRDAASVFWTAPDLQENLPTLDIVHANNFWCPAGLGTTRVIYTLYDLGFLAQPWWTTEANRIGCFDGVFRAATYADWVVAISEASRAHFLRVFPTFPAERTRVIYPCSRFREPLSVGVRPSALASISPGDFLLSVGTVEPRKNQERLVASYAEYRAAGGKCRYLVLAGGNGWLMDDFAARIERLGVSDEVILTGYVSDDELIWLYRNCWAHLYPSLFEGFGLPVLEGMQFGAATVCSNTTSLPEVAGESAILVDPLDTVALTSAMLALDEVDVRNRLREQALARASRFRWEDAAEQLLDLYQQALMSPKRVPTPASEAS